MLWNQCLTAGTHFGKHWSTGKTVVKGVKVWLYLCIDDSGQISSPVSLRFVLTPERSWAGYSVFRKHTESTVHLWGLRIMPRVEGQATQKLLSCLPKSTAVPGAPGSPGARWSLPLWRMQETQTPLSRPGDSRLRVPRRLSPTTSQRANIFNNTQGRLTKGPEWAHSNFNSKSLPPLLNASVGGRKANTRYRRRKKGRRWQEESVIGRLLRRQGNGKNDLIPKKSPRSGKHTPDLAVTPYWVRTMMWAGSQFPGSWKLQNTVRRRGSCTPARLVSTRR